RAATLPLGYRGRDDPAGPPPPVPPRRSCALPRSPRRAGRPPSGRQPPPGGRTRGRRIRPAGTRGAGDLAGRPGPTGRSENEPYPVRPAALADLRAEGSRHQAAAPTAAELAPPGPAAPPT